MPLLNESEPEVSDAATPHLLPPPQQQPAPSGLEVAAAAERQGNIFGQLQSRYANDTLSPAGPYDPTFNAIDHIPAGYLHDYGHRFMYAGNQQQVDQIQRQIDSELADQAVIARAGPRGTAAVMAAGATDPLTLATMAIAPEAAPTRLGNAFRWGLTNAAATGLLELESHSLSETATTGESMANIAAGAVVGGILGPLAPRVPRGSLARVASDLEPQLRLGNNAENVLGPQQRSVLDATADAQVTRPAPVVHEQGPIVPAPQEREPPVYVPPRPEGPTKPRPGVIPPIDPQRMSLTEAIAVTRAAGADTHGLSLQEAIAQGLDPASLKGRFGSRRIFTRGGASFDAMAESLAQHGYPVLDEAGAYSPNALLDALDKELRGNRQYSQHATEYLGALEAHEHGEVGAAASPSPYEADLERDALMLEALESQQEEARRSVQEEYLPGEPAYVNPHMESTMGAAAVSGPTMEGLTTARGARALTATIGQVTPGGRVMTSASVKARQLLTELANVPGNLEQSYRGVATANPIERLLWRYDGVNMQGRWARRAAYATYLERMQREGQEAMSRRDFMDAVSAAMRRGDRSPVAEVAQAAARTRAIVFEPLFQRARALGLLPDEIELHADSYLTRQYDVQKIRGDYSNWLELLRQGFMHQGVDPAEATDIAHRATRNIMGSERGTMDWHALDGVVPQSGTLKERTLRLPDELLERYLVQDIDHLSHSYLRSMAPEVEFTERFGSRDMHDQLGEITDEYGIMIERAREAGDNAKMAALDKERDGVIRDLSAIRDRLYGIYGAPKDPGAFAVRAGRLMRQVNALRLLGAATLAHFPDIANTIARYGTANTFAAMAKLATSVEASRLGLREAQRMGAAIDMQMNVSASILGDYGTHSRFLEQRVANGITRAYTIATGETPLITLVQGLAATLGQDEILRTAERVAAGEAIGANLSARLAAAGLDAPMLERIARAAAPHQTRVNGLRFGMSERWADQGAARAFESAVLRDAHGVTLRPGVGDSPLFMSKEWGKLVFQFKSFAFAASRVVDMPVMQGLAHGDLRSAEAMLALIAMGTLSYAAKQKAAGQPIELNPGRLAAEVLDKSNLLGWTGEVIFPALWMAGFKDLSRWSDRDPAETIGGPSAGMLASAWEHRYPARVAESLVGQMPGQENLPFRRSDLHFLRRMVPGQNLWYFRRAVNHLEDGIADLFDLPGKSNEDRELAAQAREAATSAD